MLNMYQLVTNMERQIRVGIYYVKHTTCHIMSEESEIKDSTDKKTFKTATGSCRTKTAYMQV